MESLVIQLLFVYVFIIIYSFLLIYSIIIYSPITKALPLLGKKRPFFGAKTLQTL